jgi:hypothetical protein
MRIRCGRHETELMLAKRLHESLIKCDYNIKIYVGEKFYGLEIDKTGSDLSPVVITLLKPRVLLTDNQSVIYSKSINSKEGEINVIFMACILLCVRQ